MKKLTRKEIAEGLKAHPVEKLLLGSNAGMTLTKKQKAFAEEVVKTGNKTQAYRKAYDTQGKPSTQSRKAQEVASLGKVSAYIEALEQAKAAESYLLPARLRSIAIHRLTGLALNDEINPAQQIKALELIGKMTEVALFTERRELVQVTDSAAMRDQLMKSLRLAISSSGSIDVEATEVDSLLAEINGSTARSDAPDDADPCLDAVLDAETVPKVLGDGNQNPEPATPPHPDPQNPTLSSDSPLHSIPHNKSSPKSDRLTPVNLSNPLESSTCVSTGVNPNKDTPPSKVNEEGEGGIKISKIEQELDMANTPVNESKRDR
jgi:hypothetical protein